MYHIIDIYVFPLKELHLTNLKPLNYTANEDVEQTKHANKDAASRFRQAEAETPAP